MKNNKNNCAFLDRDGVINFDRGYIKSFSKIKFRKGVIDGLRLLTKKKYLIFIITNQAGIAKGFIKYKECSLFSKIINFFGLSLNICLHSSDPIEPPPPVIQIFAFFIPGPRSSLKGGT